MAFVGTDGYWTTGLEALQLEAVTGIHVSAPGYANGRIKHAEVLLDPDLDGLLIELRSGTRLSGFVINAATGAPLARARVRRFTDGDAGSTTRYLADSECVAIADAYGLFSMERVPSGRMYLITDKTSLPIAIEGPFLVPPHAQSMQRTITVGSGGRLTGRLLGAAAEALAGERISLVALEAPSDDRRLETTTDGTGDYSFDGLFPGLYHLSWGLTHRGKSVGYDLLHLVQIEPNETLVFDLQPQGRATLRGTILSDEELPEHLSVTLHPKQESSTWVTRMRAALVENGEFVATNLEPGEWRVNVFYQAGQQLIMGSAKVDVPDDGAASVTLTLRAIRR